MVVPQQQLSESLAILASYLNGQREIAFGVDLSDVGSLVSADNLSRC